MGKWVGEWAVGSVVGVGGCIGWKVGRVGGCNECNRWMRWVGSVGEKNRRIECRSGSSLFVEHVHETQQAIQAFLRDMLGEEMVGGVSSPLRLRNMISSSCPWLCLIIGFRLGSGSLGAHARTAPLHPSTSLHIGVPVFATT